MKKVYQRMMSRQFISLVLSSLLLVFVFSAIPPEIKEVSTPQQEVVVVEKPKWVHTLSTWELSKLYTLKDDPNMDTTINLTTPEATLLMQVARSEGGESLIGQAWVMRVLLNRIDSDRADFEGIETIGQVVFQGNQFQVVTSGSYKKADVNTNTHLALAMVESGWDETDGALWFESISNSGESWHKRNLTFIKEVEGNLFYK